MRRVLLSVAALLFPLSVAAIPTPFDFTTLGANNTLLANSVTVNGVLAEGLLTNFTAEPLWLRNEPSDHGLGVCSEGQSACLAGAGDVNELTNQVTPPEAIRLTLPAGATAWTSLWVSSLDSGGSNGNESGYLLWSSTPTGFDLSLATNAFEFSFTSMGSPGSSEADIFSAAIGGGFTATSPYLLFINDPNNCQGTCNNDYLVWRGAYDRPLLQVPEPGTVALLGAALIGLMLRRRKPD